MTEQAWKTSSKLAAYLNRQREGRLATYRLQPLDVEEHWLIERHQIDGAYGSQQLRELVQNAIDAIVGGDDDGEHHLEALLTEEHLYVANSGRPIDESGIQSLLSSHRSAKEGEQIGRFGLGFKSVLGLGDAVDVFSRGASLHFDRRRSHDAISEVLPSVAEHVPALRLAWPYLEPEALFAQDPRLAELAKRATTVVRIRLWDADAYREAYEQIAEDFAFSSLLFSHRSIHCRIEAVGAHELPSAAQRGTVVRDGVLHLLEVEREGTSTVSTWRVFERDLVLPDHVQRQVEQSLYAKASRKLRWAVPCEGLQLGPGKLCAYFPVIDSAVPGLLDAAWQTNNDRQNVLETAYNQAIVDGLAELVAEWLPELVSDADRGFAVELLPRAAPYGLDARLRAAVLRRARQLPIVPRASGKLDTVVGAELPPLVAADLQTQWCDLASAEAKDRFVHVDVAANKERRDRLKELLAIEPKQRLLEADLATWISQVPVNDLASSRALLQLLIRICDPGASEPTSAVRVPLNHPSRRWERELPKIRQLAVVWTNGNEAKAVTDGVFLPGPGGQTGRHTVHPALLEDPEAARALTEILHVGPESDEQWVKLFDNVIHDPTRRDDEELWRLLGVAPSHVVVEWLGPRADKVLVLTHGGSWVRPSASLRAGRIVPRTNRAAAPDVVLDERFEERHRSLLPVLGIEDVPTPARSSSARRLEFEHEAYDNYTSSAREALRQHRARRGQRVPQHASLSLNDPGPIPTPFAALMTSEATREATTLWAVESSQRLELTRLVYWDYVTATESESQTERSFISPTAALIWQRGVRGALTVRAMVRIARSKFGELLELQSPWVELLERLGSNANPFGHQALQPEDLRLLEQTLGNAKHPTFELLSDLYDELARQPYWRAERVWTGLGRQTPISELRLTLDRTSSLPDTLWIKTPASIGRLLALGASALGQVRPIASDVQASVTFSEVFWELATNAIGQDGHWKWVDIAVVCHVVKGLSLELEGRAPVKKMAVIHQDALWVDADDLKDRRIELMDAAFACIRSAGMAVETDARTVVAKATAALLRSKVESASSLEEKLLTLVDDEVVERLYAALGDPEKSVLGAGRDPLSVVRLHLASHGREALQKLDEEGVFTKLSPPGAWGSDERRRFLEGLGFPVELLEVGASRRRSPFEDVLRVPALGELHDFQIDMLAQLKGALEDRGRALLTLPTGAGKTRVTVELLVREVLVAENRRAPLVLWLADRDELCEQAVACFRHVWQHRGSESPPLRISRLWGGNTGRVVSTSQAPHVVVATVQTLANLTTSSAFEWLRRATAVVVDEAHHYPANSYVRNIDRWLLDSPGEQPRLIGLSATPIRSDDDEAKRLQRTFVRLIPERPTELRARLIEDGVLSKATFQVLETAREAITFHPDELRHIEQYKELPPGFLERIGRLTDRNQQLLHQLLELKEHAVLVFCASVYQARWLAAALSVRGQSAVAIVGETSRGLRRGAVDGLRGGELRFVTTHTLLATGFDAPKVDAVVIARPTLSRVLFLQMIGRGLRGPKNDGTPECTIYTVQDNLDHYGQQIEQVWKDAEAAWR